MPALHTPSAAHAISLGLSLPGALSRHGLRVRTHLAHDAQELLLLAHELPAQLAVLRHGPALSDPSPLVGQLRERSALGIVVICGETASATSVQVLHAGADLSLSAPVTHELLAATLSSLQRRLPPDPRYPPSEPSQGWRFSRSGRRLLSPVGASIPLTAPERSVLACLIAHAGSPVDRHVLAMAMGGDEASAESHRLDMLVYRLRRKVHHATAETFPLVTLHGMGYQFLHR